MDKNQSSAPRETLEQTTARINKERNEFYKEAFRNTKTNVPYDVPCDIKAIAKYICDAYRIKGLSDPMYIANTIAFGLGRGDGNGQFNSLNYTRENVLVYELKTPDYFNELTSDDCENLNQYRWAVIMPQQVADFPVFPRHYAVEFLHDRKRKACTGYWSFAEATQGRVLASWRDLDEHGLKVLDARLLGMSILHREQDAADYC